jgi:hypothetical protein
MRGAGQGQCAGDGDGEKEKREGLSADYTSRHDTETLKIVTATTAGIKAVWIER